MATIDQFGGTTDNLDSPPLGGPTGWAAAVRDSLNTKALKVIGNLLTDNQASGTDTVGDTSGFTATNATLLSDTGWAAQGTRSIRVTATSTEAHLNMGGTYTSGTIPVVAGTTYTFQAFLRQAAATHSSLIRICWWTSAGNVAASTSAVSSSTTALTNAGALYQASGAAPANAAFCSLVIFCTSTSAGTIFHADKLGFWVGSGGTWAMPGTPTAPSDTANKGYVDSVATTIISGTVAPTAGDGADGNYYLDKTAQILYGPKSPVGSYGAAENIIGVTPTASVTDATNYTLGIKFRAVVAGRVTGVRFYRHASSATTSRSMHLWSAAGSSLATGTTSSESGAGWKTVTFGTPVNLTAGTIYTASFNNPASQQYYVVNTSVPVTSNTHFDSLEGKYATAVSTFPNADDGPPGYNFYVDIIFEPEPATWPIALRGTPTVFAVGTVEPTSPSLNDIWVDTN